MNTDEKLEILESVNFGIINLYATYSRLIQSESSTPFDAELQRALAKAIDILESCPSVKMPIAMG